MSANFQHGLFGCFDNCTVCLITYLVPCYTAGKVAEKTGDSCLLCGLVQCVPIVNIVCNAIVRQKVRDQKGIAGGLITDILVSWCCYCCALAQEAQEVNAIGSLTMARE